ncbi:hypothetical protein [Oleispirillum naphthae]|uniref:hypothetical protein n=1 Tax=Oleispirillum naphthae TaxID=2838853 RepID=UPI0030826B41
MRVSTLRLCAAFYVALAAPAIAAPACLTLEEASAVQVRQFHTRLQVAALKCSDPGWGLRDRYNAYVTQFGGSLSANAKALRAALSRTGVARSDAQFDRFITRIANRASGEAENTADYCTEHRDMLDAMLSGAPSALGVFAAAHEPPVSGPGLCVVVPEIQSAAVPRRRAEIPR